jgi:hypothetical protein
MAESKLKLLVCVHKKDVFLCDDTYMPIHVGKAISDLTLGIQGDDTGDNISSKNKNYCELTGIYWAWKNLIGKNIDYIGFCHYRRYFNFQAGGFYIRNSSTINTEELNKIKTSDSDVVNILNKYDIILAKPLIYRYNLSHDYSKRHISEDLKVLEAVIKELTPEYIPAYNEVMNKNNKLSPCNMFVTNRKIYDNYCTWLFCILEELEKRIDISAYDSVQARIWGYMSERLLNVYVKKNHMRVKYCPIIGIVDNGKKKNIFRYYWPRLRNSVYFFFRKV